MAEPLPAPPSSRLTAARAAGDVADPAELPARIRLAVAELAGTAAAWCPALSPTGDRVAYVTDRSGTPRLEVIALEPASAAALPVVVSGADEEVVSVAWAPDGAWLAYLVSPGGSICAQLHVVRPDGTDHRVVAGADPRETVFAGHWTRPGHYVCSIAPGIGPDADVVLVDVETGAHRTLARGGFLSVTAVSADERWVLARRGPRGYRHVVLANVATGVVRRVIDEDAPGGVASEDGRFAPDGGSVLLRPALPGPPGADRAGLVEVPFAADGELGTPRVVLARPDADLDAYALLADGTVLGVWNCGGVTQLRVHDRADGAVLADIELPEPVLPGWSLAADGETMVAELTGPHTPRGLWLVPLTASHRSVRLPAQPRRPDRALSVDAVRLSYAADDGTPLSGWLYRARGAHGPGPTVVSFHGGPEGQERPSYSPVAQSLVAAGFTVFAPNVRGSSGEGRAFMSADDGAAREASFADVPATVRFLVDEGLAVPGRVGAHGWSYGGYLTLVALTRWPDLFAAGVSLAGMSDLRSFFAGTEPWMAAASVTEYGDPVADREMLASIAPLNALDRLRAPVLLAHGDRDTNVPVAESVQAHQALQALGAVSELLLLPGEGHTIVGREHLIELTERVAAWFTRWL